MEDQKAEELISDALVSDVLDWDSEDIFPTGKIENFERWFTSK